MIRVKLNSTSGEKIVTDEFKSWDERRNVISRSEKYYGVIITESLELTFIGSAYDYLKALDDASDIAADCDVTIQLYDNDTTQWNDDFVGKIDFTTKKQNDQSGKQITYSAYSNNFANKLLEREDISIPYDRLETLDGSVITPFTNEYTTVEVLGVPIALDDVNSSFPVDDGESQQELTSDGTTRNGIPEIDNDISNPSFNENIKRTFGGSRQPTNIISGDCFYLADVEARVKVQYSVDWEWIEFDNVSNPNSGDFEIKLFKITFDESGNVTLPFNEAAATLDSDSFSFSTSTDGTLATGTLSGTVTVDLEINEGLVIWLYQIAIGPLGGSSNTLVQIEPTSFLITDFSQKAPPSNAEFVTQLHAFDRTVHAITDQDNPINSDLLTTGINSEVWLTNGKLLRQFPTGYQQTTGTVAQLTFKFNDLFTNINKVFNIGCGVEYDTDQYKLRIEEKDYFFDQTVLLTIDADVIQKDSFEVERNLERYYQVISHGYEYEQPEAAGTLLDYNTSVERSSPIVFDSNYDILSQYNGSGYCIEAARREAYDPDNLKIGEVTDGKYDDLNFLFSVYDDTGTYIQRTTEGFSAVNNIDLIDTPINLIITPTRNLLRHGWWINTGLKGYQSDKLKYNKSKITTNLETQLSTESAAVKENEDINISDLESSLFNGETVRFTAPVGSSTFNLIKDNPYQVIKFWNPLDQEYQFGWIQEVSTNIVDKQTNWQLIKAVNIPEGDNFRITDDGGFRLLDDGSFRLIS